MLNVIRKDRVVDDSLKRQIDADRLHICERHFSDYQFYFYATRKSLKEGAIPTLNLLQKAIPSITSPPRSTITITKREDSSATQVLSSSALFYKDFLQFKQRIVKLQINDTWSINLQDNYAILTFLSETHFVPKYELFADQSLRFTLRIYGWMLPEDHNLYLKFERVYIICLHQT